MVDIKLYRWQGESHASGGFVVESGVFPPRHSPPARLATLVCARMSVKIYRASESQAITSKQIIDLLTSSGTEYAYQYNELNGSTTYVYEVGTRWEKVSREIAHWSDKTRSLTVVARRSANLFNLISAEYLSYAHGDGPAESFRRLNNTGVDVYLVSQHQEKIDFDEVNGVAVYEVLKDLPEDIESALAWS